MWGTSIIWGRLTGFICRSLCDAGVNDLKQIYRSKQIFDGYSPPFKGYIAVAEGKIESVGHGWDYGELMKEPAEVFFYDEKFIMPALHDNHVFFSGYLAMHAGLDLRETGCAEEALELIRELIRNEQLEDEPVYAYGWQPSVWGEEPSEDLLNQLGYQGAVTAIAGDRSYCWMNGHAKKRYHFTEKETSAESRVHLIKEMLANEPLVQEVYRAFEEILLSKGVISIKEIIFDDGDFLFHLPERKILSNCYVQAVEGPLDKERMKAYQQKDFPAKVSFGGVKIMVDGVVADETGDVYGAYSSGAPLPAVSYSEIEAEVEAFNEMGIPVCLTTEGDKAGHQAAVILAKYGKRLPAGLCNSISDLEMITEEIAAAMKDGGIAAEIYPQVLGLNPSLAEAYMPSVLEPSQAEDFFNYRCLTDHGVLVTSGTDLPLFITDVPESILRAVFRRFPEGEETWHEKGGLSVLDLLQSFTANGFRMNGLPQYGRLEAGRSASFAVYDRNLFSDDWQEAAEAEVSATILDGVQVYKRKCAKI